MTDYLDITDVIGELPTKDGSFDIIMERLNEHLIKEYTANRITGDTYAQVYIQMMQLALQSALQLSMQEPTINKGLDLVDKQIENLDITNESVAQDLINKKAQVQDRIEELVGVTDEFGTVEGSIGKQKDSIDSSIEINEQKLLTEKAQIQDTIKELIGVTDEVGTVEGSIGKQKDVYDTQITAFRDNARQSFLSSLVQTWSVRRTTDSSTEATSLNLLTDMEIGLTVKEVADNLGIELPEPTPPPDPE